MTQDKGDNLFLPISAKWMASGNNDDECYVMYGVRLYDGLVVRMVVCEQRGRGSNPRKNRKLF